MCLIIKDGEDIQVATQDIVCYKILAKNRLSFLGFYQAPYMGKLYWLPLNRYFSTRQRIKIDGRDAIYRGYHAYTKTEANFRSWVLFKCVIPKGTLHALGVCDEIVSEKILIKKKFK